MPKISVVMPVYNAERYLKEAIESILAQSEPDFEFIIINDGSTDGSLAIIDEYKKYEPRIRLVSRGNMGLVFSLNEGIELARGEYVARMDADDVSYPLRFEKQLEYIKKFNLVMCGTLADGVNYPPASENIRSYIFLHNPFIHSSVLIRKDIVKKVGLYKRFFKYVEDYELWTRVVFEYKTGNIMEPLMKYRFHDAQTTRRNKFGMRLRSVIVRILAFYRFIIAANL